MRCSPYLGIMFLLFAVSPLVSGEDPDAGLDKKRDANRAVARITGPLICTHCDLGVGDECCTGIRIEDTVIILSGKANLELLDDRLNGVVRRVVGNLAVEDGHLHLVGVCDKNLPAGAEYEMQVTGRVVEKGGKWALADGKQAISLDGDVTKTLAARAGQWVEVRGQLEVNRQGHIRLTSETAKPVPGPPVLPGQKR